MFNYSLSRRGGNLCDNISIINFGKRIIEGSKNDLLNIISIKSVAFVLIDTIKIPDDLREFNPVLTNNVLELKYDKNKTNIKNIIDKLNNNKIEFKEINTNEGDLEDVFKKVVKSNDTTI